MTIPIHILVLCLFCILILTEYQTSQGISLPLPLPIFGTTDQPAGRFGIICRNTNTARCICKLPGPILLILRYLVESFIQSQSQQWIQAFFLYTPRNSRIQQDSNTAKKIQFGFKEKKNISQLILPYGSLFKPWYLYQMVTQKQVRMCKE